MHHRAPAGTPPPTSANANTSASASLFCASATLSPVNHRATTGLPSQQPQPQPAASFLGELQRPNASSSSCFSSPPQSLRQSTTLPPLSPLNVNLGMSLNLPLPSSSSFYSPSSSTLTPPFEGAVQPSNNMSYPHFPIAPSSSRPLCSSTTAPTSLSSSRDGTSCSPASSSGLLKGKTFYLDVTTASLRQQLCAQLCSLGATVHPFFSDAVSHMITDRHISSEEKRQIIQQNQQLAAGRSASSERSGVSPPLSPPSTSSSSSSYPCSSAANANEGCPSPLSSASFYPPTDRSNASDPESNESSLISQLRSLKKSHLSSSATTKRSCPRQQSTKTLSPSSSFCFPPSPASSCTSPMSFPHHHLQRILNPSSLPLPSTNHNVVSAPSGLALIGLAYSLNKKIYHVNKFQPWLDKHCSELKSTTTAGFPHLQQHSQQRACNNKLQLQMPSQRCLQASSAPSSSGVVPTSLLGADPISIIAGSPCLAPPPISIPIPISMPHSSTPNLLQNDTIQQRQRQQPQHAGCASSLEQPSLRFPFDLRPKTKYIMVEDLEGAFKPICKHFTCDGSSGSEVPTLNFNAPKGCSPFTSSPSSSSAFFSLLQLHLFFKMTTTSQRHQQFHRQ
ncbi:hypothetical protein QOT17_008610 [Balamuthia mandrillaris]